MPPPLQTEPIGLQMTRAEPRLADMPFRVLLDFERPTDLAFLVPQAGAVQVATEQAHTGFAALKLEHGGTFEVKLGSLLAGSAFPGNWTLAGAYFSSAATAQSPVTVTVAYRVASSAEPLLQRTVEISGAKTWTPIFVDLTELPVNPSAEAGLLTFQVEAAQSVYCDDVVLINNSKVLEAPAGGGATAESGWTIRQNGLVIDVQRPRRFRVTLKTPEGAADGWTTQEADDLRARFVSTSGKTWTIYADGRQYQDGQFSPLAPLGDAAVVYGQQNVSPAELVVPEEFGRIDRDTPGDQNNDGYNERRGSYELVAKGARLEVTLKPTTRLLARPVLEIAGLPAGNALATVEGQLIERTTRLPNGNLLIEIPLVLERPTTINVAVK
jgi:hypothetical protein